MRHKTIRDIMHGLIPGEAQTVGNMTVIPLISDIIDETIATPEVLEMGTVDYGTVEAYNSGTEQESGLTISPMGNVVLTSRAAQNHAVPDMKIVPKGKRIKFKNAACVQERQGGLIQKGRYRLTLLPLAMREDALAKRNTKDYTKLWPSIRSFNKSLGLTNVGHLEYYMQQFKKEMDLFVAQFEVVPDQVGAIILINGGVVGIERYPNYAFFKVMWEPLIRECYGSMSIQAARAGGLRIPKNRVRLSPKGVKSLADIKRTLEKAKEQEKDATRKMVNAFIEDEFSVERDKKTSGYIVETLANPQFNGQMVRKKEIPLMFSFVKTKAWMDDPNHEKFATADEFRM